MTHDNRSRVKIEPDGDWTLFTSRASIPAGAEVLGVVTRGNGDSGALVRIANGGYVQINDGAMIVLDGRKVTSALGLKSNGGRREMMDGGKRVNVYLTEEAIARAKEIGNGNVSEGIRVALFKG